MSFRHIFVQYKRKLLYFIVLLCAFSIMFIMVQQNNKIDDTLHVDNKIDDALDVQEVVAAIHNSLSDTDVVLVNVDTVTKYEDPGVKEVTEQEHQESEVRDTGQKISYCHNKEFYASKMLYDHYDEATLRNHPNLPKFLTQSGLLPSILPDITSIRWTGTVFQESWKYQPRFLLYSAHFDTRLKDKNVLRIVALFDGVNKRPSEEYWCQIWNTIKGPAIVTPATYTRVDELSYSPDVLAPYIITCNYDNKKNTTSKPIAVSLVQKRCTPSNNILQISGATNENKGNEREKNFTLTSNITVGICGKALFYYNEDISLRLIEWVEFMKILKVSKIFLYKMQTHPNVEKVLRFYEKEGIIKLITFSYPPPYVHEPTFIRLWSKTKKTNYRSAQKIYLNDCLLRNKEQFDYLAVIDIDEVPVLKKHKTLPELLKYLKEQYPEEASRESFFLKWKLFYSDISPGKLAANISDQFYILRHNQRSKLNSKEIKVHETNGKTIYDTNHILGISIHGGLLKLSGNEKPKHKTLKRELAYIAHFGDKYCKDSCKVSELVEEDILLQYKDEIISKFNTVTDYLKKNYFYGIN